MQKVMVMCLVASAVLAAGCATLRELGSGKQVRRAMLAGAGIGVGTGTVAGVATTGGDEAEAMILNSTAWRYRIERNV